MRDNKEIDPVRAQLQASVEQKLPGAQVSVETEIGHGDPGLKPPTLLFRIFLHGDSSQRDNWLRIVGDKDIGQIHNDAHGLNLAAEISISYEIPEEISREIDAAGYGSGFEIERRKVDWPKSPDRDPDREPER